MIAGIPLRYLNRRGGPSVSLGVASASAPPGTHRIVSQRSGSWNCLKCDQLCGGPVLPKDWPGSHRRANPLRADAALIFKLADGFCRQEEALAAAAFSEGALRW
jgi:hypothetical protein